MNERTTTVENITCGHCVNTIQRELADLEGVSSVEADQASGRVTVSFDASTSSWADIESLLVEIGYPPKG